MLNNEVQHFTVAPEIQHFAVEKVNKNDNTYGVRWGNLVRKFLQTVYLEKAVQAEIVSDGITYNVLKREKVTVFYDAEGNTLFDVENERLEKDYGWLLKETPDNNAAEYPEGETPDDLKIGESDAGREQVPMETVLPDGVVKDNISAPTMEEIKAVEEANVGDIKVQAHQKLQEELEKAKDKTFAAPVIKYLLERCEDDKGLCEDICQPHKTWSKCLDYIYSQARKQATGSRCAVRDDVVYEWAEDYYHKDDKAAEDARAKKEAERKKADAEKVKKSGTGNESRKKVAKKKESKGKAHTQKLQTKEEKKKVTEKQKRSSKEIDGQMDIFSLLEM